MQRGYAERCPLCRGVLYAERCYAERCPLCINPLCINPSKMSVFDARYCPLSGSGDSTEEH